MTTDEFKKLKPDLANLDGNDLWDAMEDYMLSVQSGQEIMKPIMPFWKTHTLRWLFYRNKRNLILGKNGWSSSERCNQCKKGVSSWVSMFMEDRTRANICLYCREPFQLEPNTNFNHKLYNILNFASNLFWSILDSIHLIRNSHHGRYDMFGDEAKYVQCWYMNMERGKSSHKLRKRKWWEYIFIEKPRFNF